MPIRQASASWSGNLREGTGRISVESKLFSDAQFGFVSRFETGPGTNPEELLGGAHAGCFSMALAGALAAAGKPPKSIRTTARVHIDKVGDGFTITKIELATRAVVPGVDDATFQKLAEQTKAGCPVSKALAAVPISLQASLVAE
jgi:osmotically inducible protein OsmC